MRKLVIFTCCLLMSLSMVGCSDSITKTYPEIEEDFTKEDYKQLKELSKNESLSYEELCWEFVKANSDEETNRIIKDLSKISTLSNLDCKKTKNLIEFSCDINIENNKTNIMIVTDVSDKSIKSISFNSKQLKFTQTDDIVEIIEGNKDSGYEVNRHINKDFNINNKIYINSGKFYYLPIENNEIRVFSSKSDFDTSYQSDSSYWDNAIKENDEMIKDLEDNLDKVEEDLSNIQDARK